MTGPTRLFCFRAICLAIFACALSPGLEPATRALGDDQGFDGEPPLRTDSDLNQLLVRAKQFADEGQFNHATTLWQKVLEDSGDTLIKDKKYPPPPSEQTEFVTYLPLAQRVERDILAIPPAGLRVYRISADPDAKAVLAAGNENDEAALAKVVHRYFLSSYGDDAAYRLGCIALDRYDFVGASRLFLKIVNEHPDPSMPLGEVWLRIAVASAHVGDFSTAEHALDQVGRVPGRPSDKIVQLVWQHVQQARDSAEVVHARTHEWTMIGGRPNRTACMKKLPAEVTQSTLTKAWEYRFDIDFTTRPQNTPPDFLPRRLPAQPLELSSGSYKDLVDRWNQLGWMPAGHLLTADGKIVLKTNERLTCWNAAASDDIAWASAWSNDYQLDEHTTALQKMFGNRPQSGSNNPFSKTEVQLFGDRVHQSMTVANDTVYSIEGPQLGLNQSPSVSITPRDRINARFGITPRRARTNYLAAYDLKTGKAKWQRAPHDEEKGETEMGFMAAPVPFANFLLVPVTEGGTIWLYALAAEDGVSGEDGKPVDVGKPVWKTFLSDEPSGGCNPWAPVGISVEGRDAYVACGTGVVFAVDAVSGDVRFAVRYHRHGSPNAQVSNRFGGSGTSLLQLDGWDDDIAVPFGRSLVVMASDHDWLFAVDRRTGEFLWKSPRKPFDHPATYFLGVTPDGGYIVGGKNIARRYDIPSGRLIWEHEFRLKGEPADSYGRGMVTEDAIYVPVKSSILKLDPQDGSVLETVAVDTKMEYNGEELVENVGNLFSDGEKLWVLAPNGIYALTNPSQERAALENRDLSGDPQARLRRMKLFALDNKMDAAVADLRAAYQEILAADPDQAAATLFGGIHDIELVEIDPHAALDLLAESFVASNPQAALSQELDNQLADILFSALRRVPKKESAGSAASVLQIVPLLKEDFQLSAACRALVAVVQDVDAAQIRQAVESDSTKLQIIAAEALAKLEREAAKPALRNLLQSPDERLRLAAGRGLASLGDNSSLTALVALLDSDDAMIRSHSVQLLRALTGQKFGYSPFAARDEGFKHWREWIEENGSTVTLPSLLPDVEPMFDRTLICLYSRDEVIELDASGNVRWQKEISAPAACQGLPNGHRLIATHEQLLIEFDAAGKEVWRVQNVPDNPFSVQRLANGNTLVACSTSQKVVEFDADGDIAWSTDVIIRPMDARRLENGNTLLALSGSSRVVEIDTQGRLLWAVDGMHGAWAAQPLENGNRLVVLRNANKVVEIDRGGEEVWVQEGLEMPCHAQRLPSGNTLIADYKRVIEVNAEGTIVWQYDAGGAFDVSRF